MLALLGAAFEWLLDHVIAAWDWARYKFAGGLAGMGGWVGGWHCGRYADPTASLPHPPPHAQHAFSDSWFAWTLRSAAAAGGLAGAPPACLPVHHSIHMNTHAPSLFLPLFLRTHLSCLQVPPSAAQQRRPTSSHWRRWTPKTTGRHPSSRGGNRTFSGREPAHFRGAAASPSPLSWVAPWASTGSVCGPCRQQAPGRALRQACCVTASRRPLPARPPGTASCRAYFQALSHLYLLPPPSLLLHHDPSFVCTFFHTLLLLLQAVT